MAQACKCSCVLFMIYALAAMNIIGGIFSVTGFVKNPYQEGLSQKNITLLSVVTGVTYIGLGILLLYSVIQRNAVCVLVYLVLVTIGTTIDTGYSVFDIISAGSALGAGVITIVILIIAISWAMIYCVYLFYKELKSEGQAYDASEDSTTDQINFTAKNKSEDI